MSTDLLQGKTRTKMCGQFNNSFINKTVTAAGWVNNYRDFGGLVFVDLRDSSGIIQVVFNAENISAESWQKVSKLRNEYVILVEGTIVLRDEKTVNENLETGNLELIAENLLLLSESKALPFDISQNYFSDPLRLQHRYLALRNPTLQNILKLRSNTYKIARDYFHSQDFMEVETPILGKSTPEGARDYLVPSRIFEGAFFALPQSPQLYKQMLMVSGVDKYFQIARCFRDEDLRADRQPEFTQIDVEMSFVDHPLQVMRVAENFTKELFSKSINYKLPQKLDIITYDESMKLYGTDKPDTRFELLLHDVSEFAQQSTLEVFREGVGAGGLVKVLHANNLYNRFTNKTLDGLSHFVKEFGAVGVSWVAITAQGAKGALVKFFPPHVLEEMINKIGATENDVLFFVADADGAVVNQALSKLRLHLADMFNLITPNTYAALWVVDFPMFEYSKTLKRLVAKHHPFTSPREEDLHLLTKNPLAVRAKAYDLVINGYEVGGGSLRIYSKDIQQQIFNTLELTVDEVETKFGFFTKALEFGTPPHGGFALGLDRLVMLLANTQDIKDVIAFPKLQTSMDPVTHAPAAVEPEQLRDVHLQIKPKIKL